VLENEGAMLLVKGADTAAPITREKTPMKAKPPMLVFWSMRVFGYSFLMSISR
jgi:hypothetical protein